MEREQEKFDAAARSLTLSGSSGTRTAPSPAVCVNARLTSAASFATLETRWSTPSPAVASCCSRLSALSSLHWRGYKPDAAGALAR